MPAIYGRQIGKEIAEALGLKGTTFIQITIPLDGPVEVSCRYYPEAAAMDRVQKVLASYHIMSKEEG